MKQPELGLKVAELRQQKNLTQEELAEICEVSARTIQRIEGGEVDPRAYTMQCLSEALEYDLSADDTARENLWLTLLHMSSTLCILIIPLVIWSWKKTGSLKIDREGKQVLNFQITMTLLLFAAAFLLIFGVPASLILIEELDASPYNMGFITIGATLPLILIGVFCSIQGIANTTRSLSGKPIRYPLSIPFIK